MSKVLKRIIITLVLVVSCTAIVVNGAMAAKKSSTDDRGGRAGSPVSEEPNSTIIMKAALRGAEKCIDGNAFSNTFNATNYTNVVMTGKQGELADDAVKLPWGWGEVSSDKKVNRMNCSQLMVGNGGSTGLAHGMIPTERRVDFKQTAYYFAGEGLDGNGGLGYSAAEVHDRTLRHSEQLIMNLVTGNYTDSTGGKSVDANVECSGKNVDGSFDAKSTPSLLMSAESGGTSKDHDAQIYSTDKIIFPRAFVDLRGSIRLDWVSNGVDTLAPNVPMTDGETFYYRSVCGNIGIKITKKDTKGAAPEWEINFGYYYDNKKQEKPTNMTYDSTSTSVKIEKIEGEDDPGAVYKFDDSQWVGTATSYKKSGGGGRSNPNKNYKIHFSGVVNSLGVDSESGITRDFKLTRPEKIKVLSGLNTSNGTGYGMDWNSSEGIFNLQLTDQEIFDLYRYYIQNVLKVEVFCKGDAGYDYDAYSDPEIQWNKCGECKAFVTKQKKEYGRTANGLGTVYQTDWLRDNVGNLYGVELSNRYFDHTITTTDVVTVEAVDEVIGVLNSLDMNNITVNDTCPGDPAAGGSGGSGTVISGVGSYDDKIVDCNRFDDLGAMQWVMCPAMNNAQYTANAVDNQVDQMLVIDADIYDSNSGAKMAWDIIRNIANVLIIVFFLIVILSQVTGYGIDNYGIKKMLPRLIVMAIVVNLSFYICELAIDLSNILGVGLRDMFASIAQSVAGTTANVNGVDGLSYTGSMITAAFAAGGGTAGSVGIGAGMAIFNLTGGLAIAIVIAVFIALLVIIVAVFTIYLMLGIRKIIVIVCIMLAPLAFAAYILPNTQNLFKKWWELFKAALVVFPICGAFFGISYMLKAVATAKKNADFGIAGSLIMMILPYAGFFLIPMLLKNAIAALGKIGGALTSLGSTISSSAKSTAGAAWKTAQGTEAFKDMQQEANRRRQQSRVDKIINRLGNRNPDELSERNQRRLLDAQQTKLKMDTEQEMAKQGMVVPDKEAVVARVHSARDAQRLKNYEDQYRYQERSYIKGQMSDAAKAYSDNRSEENRLWLQAAYNEAERRNMDKEMWDDDNNFTSLAFSTGNEQDRRFLEALSGSNDVVRSQFGKQMSNYNGDAPATLNNFVDRKLKNKKKNDDGTETEYEVSLMTALNAKGPDSLNTANDDTINYLNRRSNETGANVVSANQLIHTGAASTDGKVQTALNPMINRANANDFIAAGGGGGISGAQLVKQSDENLNALVGKAMETGGEALRAELQSAVNAINKSPELSAGLRDNQNKQFARLMGAAASATQTPRVPSVNGTSAGGASASGAGTGGVKYRYTGEQLFNQSSDTLRSIASTVMNDGEGSSAYKTFMAGVNDIANDPSKMANLGSEKRQIIHGVVSKFNPHDTRFGGGPQAPNVPK